MKPWTPETWSPMKHELRNLKVEKAPETFLLEWPKEEEEVVMIWDEVRERRRVTFGHVHSDRDLRLRNTSDQDCRDLLRWFHLWIHWLGCSNCSDNKPIYPPPELNRFCIQNLKKNEWRGEKKKKKKGKLVFVEICSKEGSKENIKKELTKWISDVKFDPGSPEWIQIRVVEIRFRPSLSIPNFDFLSNSNHEYKKINKNYREKTQAFGCHYFSYFSFLFLIPMSDRNTSILPWQEK